MTSTRDRIESLVMRIQTDYLEHPTLALTLPAAQTAIRSSMRSHALVCSAHWWMRGC